MKESDDISLFDLYLDYDNTIVNSNKEIVSYFNKMFDTDKDYKKLYKYNYSDLFKNLSDEEIENAFSRESFFENVEMLPDFLETFNFIKKYCEITIATKGTNKNIELKKKWIDKNLGNNINTIHVVGCDMDKSSVDMSGAVFIDDHIDCLRSSNAKIKILIKDHDTEYNKLDNDEIYVVSCWKEVKDILSFYIENGGIV